MLRGGALRSLRPTCAILAAWTRPMSTAATSPSTASTGALIYEGQRAVDEYVQMHFGAPSDVFPYGSGATDGLAFPERCANAVISAFADAGRDPAGCAALDVGCAVGGASFALAKHFARVDGVDFSAAFVAAARTLQAEGQLDYAALVEGTRTETRTAHLTHAGPSSGSVTFSQGDACALEALRDTGTLKAEGYDAVLASNLLCRLPRPRAFLRSCADWLVQPGGTLVLLTPFSWLEAWTPQSEWIGGGDLNSSEELAREMAALGFTRASRTDVPFLIREHARKFQCVVRSR